MEKIGILKELDKLGRLVIAKNLRERYLNGGKVEIIATEDGILLRDPEYVLTKKSEKNQQAWVEKSISTQKRGAPLLFFAE